MKNITNKQFALQTLLNAGFDKKISYYLNRGVNSDDLNASKLLIIFNELDQVNHLYAKGFIDLVNSLQILDTVDFIVNYIRLADNDFIVKDLKIVKFNDKEVTQEAINITKSIRKDIIEYTKPYYNQIVGLKNNTEGIVVNKRVSR